MNVDAPVLLAAKDPVIVEAVEASALALKVPLIVVTSSDELAQHWPRAPLRLLAPDMIARAARLRGQVPAVLVGSDAEALARGSAELGYPVVLLPVGAQRLADLLVSTRASVSRTATVVSLVSASGGLGASTLTLGLGGAAARDGLRVVVVELARFGGGLDLLAGQESREGVRWGDLIGARGQLGGLDEALVACGDVRILALSRDNPVFPDQEAVRAVLASLGRTCDVVIVDAGQVPVPQAQQHLLMVSADVRGVASARMLVAGFEESPTGLVVRAGIGRRIGSEVVATSLGASLVGTLRDEPSLSRLAEIGEPPWSRPAKRFDKDVRAMWKRLGDG